MITIRSPYPVPTLTNRRIEPAGSARGSNDRQPRQDRAQAPVPTPHVAATRSQPHVRAQVAPAELIVQIISGAPRRGIRAETSEQARYRRAYQDATQKSAPPPMWERRA